MDQKIILVGIMSILSWVVYKYYQKSEQYFDESMHYRYASEYFIGDDRMHPRKPFLWVHTSSEVNAREWESLYSRNSTRLNQPFLFLTMKSILDKCKDSFNVCLIDDDVFRRLIPQWEVKMDALPSPVKEHYRQFALTTLLYYYGGMTVPASTLCLHDLHALYKDGLAARDAFAVEMPNRSAGTAPFLPDPRFMGCRKRSELVEGLMKYEGSLLKKDTTSQADFLGALGVWCKANMSVVCGMRVGVKKPTGEAVDLSELLGNNAIELCPHAQAIYIPADEILTRPKYAWFSRLSQEDFAKSDLALAKYL